MKQLTRITLDPKRWGENRVAVCGLPWEPSLGFLAEGHSTEEILNAYPHLEVREALSYAAG